VAIAAALTGDGFRLVLRVAGYERHDVHTGDDANWLTAEFELTLGTYGTYQARQRVSLFAPDIAAFATALRSLDRDLTGQAKLEHLEDELAVTITLNAGKGMLAGYVREHVAVKLSYREINTDQTHVREARQQFDGLVAAFPPR
jgi:hypothetical protein